MHLFEILLETAAKLMSKSLILANALIDKQLIEEIKLTIAAKNSSNDTNDAISNDIKQCDDATKIDDLDLQNTVKLTCSYDIGWSKRVGGRIYDSASGHGYLVGVNSGRIVGWGVKKKKCSQCEVMLRKYDEILPHDCNINYSGSSGGMESRLAVDLLSNIWNRSNGKVAVGTIVADDDSTMKSNTANKKDGGVS